MVNLSVFSSRLSDNTKALEDFDRSIRYFKSHKDVHCTPEIEHFLENIKVVLTPILETISGNLSTSTVISEHPVLSTLKKRRKRDWFKFKKEIQTLYSKFSLVTFELTDEDFEILNEIADALDAECAKLFLRMSES